MRRTVLLALLVGIILCVPSHQNKLNTDATITTNDLRKMVELGFLKEDEAVKVLEAFVRMMHSSPSSSDGLSKHSDSEVGSIVSLMTGMLSLSNIVYALGALVLSGAYLFLLYIRREDTQAIIGCSVIYGAIFLKFGTTLVASSGCYHPDLLHTRIAQSFPPVGPNS